MALGDEQTATVANNTYFLQYSMVNEFYILKKEKIIKDIPNSIQCGFFHNVCKNETDQRMDSFISYTKGC
jgi:hypothetical protein